MLIINHPIFIAAAGSFLGGLTLALFLWLMNLLSKLFTKASILERLKKHFSQNIIVYGNNSIYPSMFMARFYDGNQTIYTTNVQEPKKPGIDD
jgi:hypothetical protein